MKVSKKGVAFLAAHEGFVGRGYLDPAGVVTIGYGFTMKSRVFAAWWRAKHSRGLCVNDRMSQDDCNAVLAKLLMQEYEPAVERKMPAGTRQHQFDAATSAVYNLGAAFMGWKAAKLWRAGKIKAAASYWATHYNTAGGRKLTGLVRRRKEEAHLFLTGTYTGVKEGAARAARPVKPNHPDPVVEEAQEALAQIGFDPGAIDGWMGRNTKAAVLAYQKNHPHLENDGIIGPATTAQLRKDVLALKDSKLGACVVAATTGSGFFGVPWLWILAGLVVILVLGGAFLVIRYRDVFTRRKNQFLRHEVP